MASKNDLKINECKCSKKKLCISTFFLKIKFKKAIQNHGLVSK